MRRRTVTLTLLIEIAAAAVCFGMAAGMFLVVVYLVDATRRGR